MSSRKGSSSLAGFIPIIVIAIVLGAYLNFAPAAPSTTVSMNTKTSFFPPNCQTACTVWVKSSGFSPGSLAISQDDSFVVVGNGQTLEVYNTQGNLIWSYDTGHSISSISISSDDRYIAVGGFQLQGQAPAAVILANGEIYLFNASSGVLLWSMSTGNTNPVWKVELSSDGSRVAAETANDIMYLDNAGTLIWSRTAGSMGMDMSADGSFVVAFTENNVTAFNSRGEILWSHFTEGSGVSSRDVAVASNGSLLWLGAAASGYNGTLYLFNKQGAVLWQRQIYSPALSIQTGSNLTALVSTNWGALLYGADGSLLKNITSSAVTGPSGCLPLPSFWHWSGGLAPVAFIDSQGDVVSSYNPGGYTKNAVLSPDRHYALIASSSEDSEFSLAFVFLGNTNYQDCQHS